jgi:hypothetical protein
MRLFKVNNGTSVVAWCSTQADADAVVRESGDISDPPVVVSAEYDVPTNRPDLLTFLNQYALGVPRD